MKVDLKQLNTNFKVANDELNTRNICLLCGKNSDLIKSHTYPKRFFERNDKNFYALKNGVFNDDLNFVDKKYNKVQFNSKNIGIFRLVCHKCDSTSFINYEKNIIEYNKDTLNEIALKSVLSKHWLSLTSEKRIEQDSKLESFKFATSEDIKQEILEIKRYKKKQENFKILHKRTLKDIHVYINEEFTPKWNYKGKNLIPVKKIYPDHPNYKWEILPSIYVFSKINGNNTEIILFMKNKNCTFFKEELCLDELSDINLIAYLNLCFENIYIDDETFKKFKNTILKKTSVFLTERYFTKPLVSIEEQNKEMLKYIKSLFN